MPRLVPIGAALAVAVAGAALSGAPLAQAAAPVHTSYVLAGYGFGMRAVGGALPFNGGDLAHVSSGCTDKAPITMENHAAGVTLPDGMGTIGAVSSHTWTSVGAHGTVNRYTQSKVSSISIGNSAGSLHLDGLVVTARAWHDSHGFHATVTPNVGTLTATAAMVPVKLPAGKLPTPTQPIVVPGLLTLSAATVQHDAGRHSALAAGSGLLLSITDPNQSQPLRLRLALVRARISDGFVTGAFGGGSWASEATGLGGTVTSSGQPREYMPCRGTGGKVQRLSLASAPMGSVGFPLSLSGAVSSQMAKLTSTRASGYERAYLGTINIGNGALILKGVSSQVNVARTGPGYRTVTTTTKGTDVGSATANGTPYSVSQLDGQTFSLPGLSGAVEVQTGLTQAIRSGGKVIGRKVIGLRLTLLDANGATTSVINLAVSQFRIGRP